MPSHKLKSYKLSMLTWQEIEKYLKKKDKIIIPIGSTEQHGTKAIMGTDHLIPELIAFNIGKRTDILVTPTLPFGMSEHHLAFPGTMSFSKETYYLVIYNLLSKLYHHGFKKILLINGHGGNRRTVNAVLKQLKSDYMNLDIVLLSWWDFPEVKKYIEKNFGKWEGHHATASETSIMMYAYPDMVSTKKVPKGKRPPIKKYTKASKPEDFKRLFPDGVWFSNPNLASSQYGKKLLKLCIDSLIPMIKKWDFKKINI